MDDYQVHTLDSAPEQSHAVLEQANEAYGMIPNLMAVMAGAPALLKAYFTIGNIFAEISLSPAERQVVLLAASYVNECTYCMAAYSTLAESQGLSRLAIDAIRAGKPIDEPKLEALRRFTETVVETRGWPPENEVQSFLTDGYTPANIHEMILGFGYKTLSNYTTHITNTPLDAPFAQQEWRKAG